MKIGVLILGSLFKIGGYQVFAYNLMLRLSMRGQNVVLIVRSDEFRKNYDLYKELPFSVVPIKNSSERFVKYFPYFSNRELRNIVTKNNINILQVIGAYPAGYLAASLNKPDIPVVLRTHGEDVQIHEEIGYGLRLNKKLDIKIRYVLNSVNRLIALTTTMYNSYLDMGVNQDNISLVPNGVDIDDFSVDEKFNSEHVKNKYGIRNNIPFLLTVGRYHKKKGFDNIPKIAKQLKNMDIDFNWLVVGDGTENILPIVNKLDLKDVITVIPAIGIEQKQSSFKFPGDDLIDLYKSSDIYVFPSLLEGFPRVILEAMAASTPIVTTDAEGCVDLVENGINGFISPKNDYINMARSIYKIVQNPRLMIDMGIASKEKSLQYDWDIVVDKYDQIYQELLLK